MKLAYASSTTLQLHNKLCPIGSPGLSIIGFKQSKKIDMANLKRNKECSVSVFNEFEPHLKSTKNRFQFSAGLNLETLNTILKEPTIFEPRLKFKLRLKFFNLSETINF